MFNVGVPKEQLYKCMSCVENDRMFYIKVNFDQLFDAAGRSDYTINGFVFEEIFPLRIKWFPLHKVLEVTLSFVKLRGVYDATIGITVTFVRR